MFLDSHCNAIDTTKQSLSTSENYAVAFSTVCGSIEYIGEFFKDCLFAMKNVGCGDLLRFSASVLFVSFYYISAVVADQTKYVQTYHNAAPAVLSHQLVNILSCNVLNILQRRLERVEYTYSTVQIGAIERECKAR